MFDAGEGHFGTVRLCRLRTDPRKQFAVKTINKAQVRKPEMLNAEIKIMLKVKHPNIIRIVDVFEDNEITHIVSELCTGGELLDRIIEKLQTAEKSLSELSAAVILKQILDAVHYCHSHNPPIVHRDLKPENILFKDKSETSVLKVIDFGLSKLAPRDHAGIMHSRVGTPYYVAPEVLRRDYTLKCDMWSIGVIAYILLCGYPPFYGDNDGQVLQRVSAGKFTFPSPEWDEISSEAKDLIKCLLRFNEAERPTARHAMDHSFFNKHGIRPELRPATDAFYQKVKLDRILACQEAKMMALANRMRQFVQASKFKRLALNILSRKLVGSEVQQLDGIFKALDKNCDGKITPAELQEAIERYSGENLIKQLVDAIDTSGDSDIDYHDFLAATMQRNVYLREDNINRVFKHLDFDRTGYVTLTNLAQITGV